MTNDSPLYSHPEEFRTAPLSAVEATSPKADISAKLGAGEGQNFSGELHYRIFVLTVWVEDETDSADPSTWRVRLEDPRNEARVGCVGTHGLADLLDQQIMQKSTRERTQVDE